MMLLIKEQLIMSTLRHIYFVIVETKDAPFVQILRGYLAESSKPKIHHCCQNTGGVPG